MCMIWSIRRPRPCSAGGKGRGRNSANAAPGMQGYNPAPPPQGSAQQHAQVAQHLAMNIPGFGNPAGLKFRGAVHASTAFGGSQPQGAAPAAYAPPAYTAPAYAAPAYAAPAYAAPTSSLAAGPSTHAYGGARVRHNLLALCSVVHAAAMVRANRLVLHSRLPLTAAVICAQRVASTTVVSAAPSAYTGGAVPLGAPSACAQSPAAPTAMMETPADFTCPITQEIMSDPVICADGHSYERESIARWLVNHQTSPKTNAQLEHTTLIPNHTLRGAISQVHVCDRVVHICTHSEDTLNKLEEHVCICMSFADPSADTGWLAIHSITTTIGPPELIKMVMTTAVNCTAQFLEDQRKMIRDGTG
jgi:hypothetical protein